MQCAFVKLEMIICAMMANAEFWSYLAKDMAFAVYRKE